MATDAHEEYAKDLLYSLAGGETEIDSFDFAPSLNKSRNAAGAMTAILCQRLFRNSSHQPTQKANTTFAWKEGNFNCRNIADRDYLWTNMRRSTADQIHVVAQSLPTAYLFACCSPAEVSRLDVWTLPEPLLYNILGQLTPTDGSRNKGESVYSIEISPSNHRIENYDSSPDLSPYHRQLQLAQQEIKLLGESRKMDAAVKNERSRNIHIKNQRVIRKRLTETARQLMTDGDFRLDEIIDARDRVFTSIIRRRGQPVFRKRLLTAYEGRCAITGCDVEAVLDAAHIVPYRGPKTNHPSNGLLLRTDLHTLFDLKLVSVDFLSRELLVSPLLRSSCYEQLQGSRIRNPKDASQCPNEDALRWHRAESGL